MKLTEALWMTVASMATGVTLRCLSLVKAPWNAFLSLVAVLIVLFYFRKMNGAVCVSAL
ncbi:UNVERIFIED_CONTAM: hypothetical protein ABIC26_003503 [Paenibacillus sp. PvR008]